MNIIFISRFTKQILHLILQTEKWDEDSIKTTYDISLDSQSSLLRPADSLSIGAGRDMEEWESVSLLLENEI